MWCISIRMGERLYKSQSFFVFLAKLIVWMRVHDEMCSFLYIYFLMFFDKTDS